MLHWLPWATKETTGPPSAPSAMEGAATQPKLATFLATVISGKSCSFNSSLYTKFQWIEYSKEQGATFCKACRHFLEMHTDHKKSNLFSETGIVEVGRCYVMCQAGNIIQRPQGARLIISWRFSSSCQNMLQKLKIDWTSCLEMLR